MLKPARSSPEVIGLLIKLMKNNHFDDHRSFAGASPEIVLLVKPMLKHYENKAKKTLKQCQNHTKTRPIAPLHMAQNRARTIPKH
jgi:hypothetical protein